MISLGIFLVAEWGVPGVPWCFETLTDLTYGRRKGELYAFGA